MNLRLAMLALAARHDLSAEAGAQLRELANLDAPPPGLWRHLPIGLAALGAVLGGLGIIFWIAANWGAVPIASKFALLETTLAAMYLGAWTRPAARLPLSLMGFLVCGGLLALIGQHYQTGADPWQLFALWATLTLPLCMGVRHDALWAAWAMVTLTATNLWAGTAQLHWGDIRSDEVIVAAGSWIPAVTLAVFFSPPFKPLTGAGLWSVRLSIVYASIALCRAAFYNSLHDDADSYFLITVASVTLLLFVFHHTLLYDLLALCALSFAANAILICRLVGLLKDAHSLSGTQVMIILGGTATCLLALTVKLLLFSTHTHTKEPTI